MYSSQWERSELSERRLRSILSGSVLKPLQQFIRTRATSQRLEERRKHGAPIMKRNTSNARRGLDAEFRRWREGGIISSELFGCLYEFYQQLDGSDATITLGNDSAA